MCQLLLCGDIELNPGPDKVTRELLEQLVEGQAKLSSEITALREQQINVEKTIKDLCSRFLKLEKQAARLDTLEQTVTSLQNKIADLEDRSRRSNLIVFGVKEEPDESAEVLKDKVLQDIFSKQLGVPCSSVGRIHRLGKPGKRRPVIIFFQDYNEKQKVLKNAYKLKGKDISLQNDYSRNTLRKRKLLWESARQEKKGKKVSLLNDKLLMDGTLYAWDDAKSTRVKLPGRQTSSD